MEESGKNIFQVCSEVMIIDTWWDQESFGFNKIYKLEYKEWFFNAFESVLHQYTSTKWINEAPFTTLLPSELTWRYLGNFLGTVKRQTSLE